MNSGSQQGWAPRKQWEARPSSSQLPRGHRRVSGGILAGSPPGGLPAAASPYARAPPPPPRRHRHGHSHHPLCSTTSPGRITSAMTLTPDKALGVRPSACLRGDAIQPVKCTRGAQSPEAGAGRALRATQLPPRVRSPSHRHTRSGLSWPEPSASLDVTNPDAALSPFTLCTLFSLIPHPQSVLRTHIPHARSIRGETHHRGQRVLFCHVTCRGPGKVTPTQPSAHPPAQSQLSFRAPIQSKESYKHVLCATRYRT